MAYYYSIHTGPEIDAAASMLDEIEDVRVETGQNKDLAVSSANQASIDADRAEAAQGTFDGDISAAEQARDEAEGARDLSQQYAGESDNARAQAVVARNGAEQAESNAAQSALDAESAVAGDVFDDESASSVKGWTGQKISGELASKVNTVSGKTLSENDYTTAEKNSLAGKQDELVSGTNIKTVNGETLLGSGDIPFEAPDGAIVGTTDTQTLTNKTLGASTSESVSYGSAITVNAGSAPFQQITLGANATPIIDLAVGVSRTIWLNPATYTVTWPVGTIMVGDIASIPASKWSLITLTGMPSNTSGVAALVMSEA